MSPAQPSPVLQSPVRQSQIAGRRVGQQPPQALHPAINGRAVAHTRAEALDHAHRRGLPALLALDFQERAERLKALAKFLGERKEGLYAISDHVSSLRAPSGGTDPSQTHDRLI